MVRTLLQKEVIAAVRDIEKTFGIKARGDRLAAQRRRDFLQSLTIVAICIMAIYTLSSIVAVAIALLGSIILTYIGKRHALANAELLLEAKEAAMRLPDGSAKSSADFATAQKFADALLEGIYERRMTYLLIGLDLLLAGWLVGVFLKMAMADIF